MDKVTRAAIAEHIDRQLGLITRRQALEAGVTQREVRGRLESGEWRRVHPGVFRVGPRLGWEQSLMAAYLWPSGNVVVSHRSAAKLWDLPGGREDVIELSVPQALRAIAGIRIHLTDTLPGSHIRRIGAFKVTSIPRTLLDLGGVTKPSVVEEAAEEALRRRQVSQSDLERVLDEVGGRGRRGTTALRDLLFAREPATPPVESSLELRVEKALVQAGLPKPQRQFPVRICGRRLRIDLAYPKHHLAIEVEGYRWHGSRKAWRADRERHNLLIGAGWRILYVTWDEFHSSSARFIEQVRDVLIDKKDGTGSICL